ncbi:1-deoxy-D-xylulose-5-phosphate synthase [Motiliproteus sp.]|uniref:1-deoxy-D-xylulose-5-phosphate synthase n=1 Tax=Motiliproteus sp. TaxID=1898955 RepID=UPI003BA89ABD
MHRTLPSCRPDTPLLDRIDDPADLRQLQPSQLPELAEQLRSYLLYSVAQSGGHFGAGLGVVELTLALHYVYNTPEDSLIWDVGHQSYPHKILTGRREQLPRIRHSDGPAPFPKRHESRYDCFGTGHSSTSISAALGMALAHQLQGDDKRAVAIIGDGAMTGGMAFEAMNHAAHTSADLLVILNDNDMSISANEGGLATYLAKHLRNAFDIDQVSRDGNGHRTESGTAAALFEALEFSYNGPIDGHDLDALIGELGRLRQAKGPQFLHVVTTKGKGFEPAEQDPVGYHAITKLPSPQEAEAPSQPGIKYSALFGDWLCQQASQDQRLVAITPAMSEGSGMVEFAQRFPERFYDVAIAEQHALTLAAGLACQQAKPVVAIYSTFLQRGYDQLIHDIALQQLDVLLAIDRSGLVGEDGPTHHGSFDLSFLRCIPELVIMTPADEAETVRLLQTGYQHPGPACVRYPRGKGPGATPAPNPEPIPLGQSRTLRTAGASNKAALLNFGHLLPTAREVAETLDLTLVDMRFVAPLDEARLAELASDHQLLVTLEENAIAGGAGSAVNEWAARTNQSISLMNLGLEHQFIGHGQPDELRQQAGLDAETLITRIQRRIEA